MPDGNYGKHQQGRSRILSYSFGAAAAADTDGVHAAIVDTEEEQTVTTGFTDPAIARNITATAGGTAGDIGAIQVTVNGTNAFGESITEDLPAFTVDTAGSVVGDKAFATVTSVVVPAHDGDGATTAIGFGDKLGLPVTLPRPSFVNVWADNEADDLANVTFTVSATAVEDNTVVTETSPDGSAVLVVDYYK